MIGQKLVEVARRDFDGCLSAGIDYPIDAESYINLQGKGYKTGKLSRGVSGSLGWIVQIPADRKVYEKYTRGPDSSIPQLSDLKAGKPNARNVGSCGPAKMTRPPSCPE
ncbi:hypothetical protein [Mesorhizobium sp.]|uniref:hypothetical protein n=1 Tax=Mesorhizobium sp. TaxID=1871066 RepID=UPI000FE2D866|nr:hypothetical protein [Mesorhizobium sp.]RWN99589.1 MAG: hypothetical protein EOS06_16810 [Mesorhizobium sp.]RWO54764.1 MAG: hypothetical protein EOS13_06245 [Mesorhizobium sp.]TIN24852.1 MAG: hypothetical protein E5Y19_21065 [Mesorhizobium sp.]TIN40188.1 MAG: hypothetical protein E5Y13_10185 [Mesorhizobium sp.]TJU87596.1 MAG: hypothetical protein E5Y15_08310 [Mesorhizobium sp.]